MFACLLVCFFSRPYKDIIIGKMISVTCNTFSFSLSVVTLVLIIVSRMNVVSLVHRKVRWEKQLWYLRSRSSLVENKCGSCQFFCLCGLRISHIRGTLGLVEGTRGKWRCSSVLFSFQRSRHPVNLWLFESDPPTLNLC